MVEIENENKMVEGEKIRIKYTVNKIYFLRWNFVEESTVRNVKRSRF